MKCVQSLLIFLSLSIHTQLLLFSLVSLPLQSPQIPGIIVYPHDYQNITDLWLDFNLPEGYVLSAFVCFLTLSILSLVFSSFTFFFHLICSYNEELLYCTDLSSFSSMESSLHQNILVIPRELHVKMVHAQRQLKLQDLCAHHVPTAFLVCLNFCMVFFLVII